MFAMCPLEVEAKVRPFLKNVRLIVSSQWIPYWPAENDALFELGGVRLEGASEREGGKDRREVLPEFQRVSPSLMIL